MEIKKLNPLSGRINSMDLDITSEQLSAWENGMLIQDAMPNLTPTEREFLITGMSAEEQKEIFG